MAIQITWTLGLLGKNATFPPQAIHVAHRKIEFYFDVVHKQVSRSPQQWYYVSNIVKDAFAFNRTSGSPRGIHFPPNTNYGNPPNLGFIADAIIHERGHNTSTQHSDKKDELMYYAIWPGKSMQLDERRRWYAGWPKKRGAPDPWAPGEAERWKTAAMMSHAMQPDYACCSEDDAKTCKTTMTTRMMDMIPIRRRWVKEDRSEIDAMMRETYPNMDQ